MNTDIALLILRLVVGALLAGHGAQKLFGWFAGGGPQGTAGMMGSLGLRPAIGWAILAGLAEFGGGMLTLLGLLDPLGPISVIGAMLMATATVHWGKPVWSTTGGAELPLTNIAVAVALILAGPGRYSIDGVLGLSLPAWVAPASLLIVALGLIAGLLSRIPSQPSPAAAR